MSAGSVTSRRPALSPSRAADFKQCPLLFRFRVVGGTPPPYPGWPSEPAG